MQFDDLEKKLKSQVCFVTSLVTVSLKTPFQEEMLIFEPGLKVIVSRLCGFSMDTLQSPQKVTELVAKNTHNKTMMAGFTKILSPG